MSLWLQPSVGGVKWEGRDLEGSCGLIEKVLPSWNMISQWTELLACQKELQYFQGAPRKWISHSPTVLFPIVQVSHAQSDKSFETVGFSYI